ncbi:MAG TPA: ribokinase [Reyranella sp.]|nr:ribokinase [Reyranella sp.]
MSRVIVCGSLNMDVIVQSERRPAIGETVLGAKVTFLPGGKGLNQAVASARLSVPTAMLGAVGDDAFGSALRDFLAGNDVNSLGVNIVSGHATGVALIQVADKDNAITVASGANGAFTRFLASETARPGDVWVGQFETPLAATQALFAQAREGGARTILNMAPYTAPAAALLKLVDIAVVNEIELSQATDIPIRSTTGMRKIAAACQLLRAKGVRSVIATLGAKGAVVVGAEDTNVIAGLKAKVVDTTGAGDCFVGALAARLALGDSLVTAAHYANAAASCSVEKLGASPSMPTAGEVAARLARA